MMITIPYTIPTIMVISNLVGVAVGRYALGRSDLTQLIASMCFGHIIGVGIVLGLSNMGVI
jgi:hypothetical protein|uniref:PSI-K n=3 Tax=Cyanidioschyzon merolae TaxID=45157 RepID=Q85G51_CYAM1|nr:photosystem I reaction center subunit X [Cyanidioschyzon merolae strain 10D]5ZGB_K Chain K, PsaK [Cyanidioschyzon merolae strain 10D]5ZGH_K Chain K, PsaK [Cyanidioschyzon merolae strain 10D]QFV16950.1 photosystem I reaction center subunit X [Cyanidioschyzon merolae]QFV17129.1 photosystem I reaction center subunit X [Cyanidioschyzon merolae]BAC76140.1 photosystem I reaction center subunit X [Cyanidioschyzon merolae strain 10D]